MQADKPLATESKARSQVGLLFNSTAVGDIVAVRYFKVSSSRASDTERLVEMGQRVGGTGGGKMVQAMGLKLLLAEAEAVRMMTRW